jgi:PBSX family phage terminase large subunit
MAEPLNFARDDDGTIIYSEKHKDYVKAILDPNVWFVEAEGAKRASKDVMGLAAHAMLLDMHPDSTHLALATSIGQVSILILDSDGFGIQHHFPNGRIRSNTNDLPGKTFFEFIDSIGRTKRLVLSGGAKANDFMSIRGANYGTVYMSESNLLHMNTLNEVKDRTMASSLPKLVGTQNPGNPRSKFYTEFEVAWQEKENPEYANDNPNKVWDGPDFKYFHFTQYDNPMFTLKRIARNERSFSNEIEKKRNFHGIRIAESGLVYSMLKDSHFYSTRLTKTQKINMDRVIAIDVGTTNPQVYLDCYIDCDFNVYVEREYYFNSKKSGYRKTDQEYVDDLKDFIKDDLNGGYSYIIVDPAAASFIEACEAQGLSIIAANNTLMGKKPKSDEQKKDTKQKTPKGVKLVQAGFYYDKIHIHDSCVEGKDELYAYSWDDKASEKGEDMPIKVHDHWCDALRYVINTHIETILRWIEYDEEE